MILLLFLKRFYGKCLYRLKTDSMVLSFSRGNMMNKKLFGIIFAIFLSSSASIFSNTAIGAQVGYSISDKIGGGNAAVTFKVAGVPMVFAADLAIHPHFLSTGITADYWITNPSLAGLLHWFTGPGLAASVIIHENSFSGVYLAGRWVIGLNMFVSDPWEIYIQTAAELGITVGNEVNFPKWRVPLNLGFRYWF